MIAVYQTKVSTMKTIEADKALKEIVEELKEEQYKVDLHLCNPDSHVETIERQKRVAKAIFRAVCSLMLFKRIPKDPP